MADTCCQLCIVLRRPDVLFGRCFRAMQGAGPKQLACFVECLRPYVLADLLPALDPEVVQVSTTISRAWPELVNAATPAQSLTPDQIYGCSTLRLRPCVARCGIFARSWRPVWLNVAARRVCGTLCGSMSFLGTFLAPCVAQCGCLARLWHLMWLDEASQHEPGALYKATAVRAVGMSSGSMDYGTVYQTSRLYIRQPLCRLWSFAGSCQDPHSLRTLWILYCLLRS